MVLIEKEKPAEEKKKIIRKEFILTEREIDPKKSLSEIKQEHEKETLNFVKSEESKKIEKAIKELIENINKIPIDRRTTLFMSVLCTMYVTVKLPYYCKEWAVAKVREFVEKVEFEEVASKLFNFLKTKQEEKPSYTG